MSDVFFRDLRLPAPKSPLMTVDGEIQRLKL